MEQRADHHHHHHALDIDTELGDLSPIPLERSIFRVHDALRNINVKAYEPQLIAIGPYHHAKDEKKAHLQPMEEHKLRYLKELLDRRKETSAQRYIVVLQQCEETARKFYAEHISLDANEFVKMMLLDGCFIIEFLRKDERPDLRKPNDPIFQLSHISSGLKRDLQLFENQLPLFVLIQLFNMTKEEEYSENKDISDLALCCFENIMQLPGQGITEIKNEEPPHLLSLMHAACCYPFKESLSKRNNNVEDPPHLLSQVHACCCYPLKQWLSQRNIKSPTKLTEAREVNDKLFIESATKLMEAGVKFSKAEGRSLFDIRFQNGTMEIPTLVVDDHTDCLFRNYIAYEQYLPDHYPKYFTNYKHFIDCLVNFSKDVEILRQLGIVNNILGDDEVVSSMVNKLGDNIIFVEFASFDECYSKVFSDVNKHCRKRRNKWLAKLKRDYFNSPWAIMSIVAGLVLLLLTATQTVFSILSVV